MVVVFDSQPCETISPGVTRSRMAPGGKDGPGGIVRDSDQPGGCTWSESWSLGSSDDPWRMMIPDIRMAANQIWPLHWHDCWTAVVVLDGSIMIGDWWMGPRDVLIAEPGVEYGLLLNGPKGCQLLEIFARDVLSPGGYGEEYRDHPTLVYLKGLETTAFSSRPPAAIENGRRQVVPVEATAGLAKGHLDGNAYWDLGDPQDPARGILFDRRLPPSSTVGPASYGDWRATLVLEGSITVGDVELVAGDLLIAEPEAVVATMTVGPGGAHLLDAARTASACRPEELKTGLARA